MFEAPPQLSVCEPCFLQDRQCSSLIPPQFHDTFLAVLADLALASVR